MNVRLANPDDAWAIADISVRAWQKAYAHILPPEKLAALDTGSRAVRWRERMTSPTPEDIWVAVDGETVAGFAAGVSKVDEPYQGEWFIVAVYVDPNRHGQGAGRQLLRASVTHGLSLGAPDVKLSVFTANWNARAFYQRCGGEEVGNGTWDWEGISYPVVYVKFREAP